VAGLALISADWDALVAASRVVASIGDEVAAGTRGAPLVSHGRYGGAALVSTADRFVQAWTCVGGVPRLSGDLHTLSAGLAGAASDCAELEREFPVRFGQPGCETGILVD
jgi:hypothetical protein